MKSIKKVFTILVLSTLPILTIGQSRLRSTTYDRLRSTSCSRLHPTIQQQDTTTLYGYKHPKTGIYYFQDRDIPYGDSMVNDAFKKYKLLVVLEQGIWSNLPLKDKPRVKNGCELVRLKIYTDSEGEIILEEEKVE